MKHNIKLVRNRNLWQFFLYFIDLLFHITEEIALTAKFEAEKCKKLSNELSTMNNTAKIVNTIQAETTELQV